MDTMFYVRHCLELPYPLSSGALLIRFLYPPHSPSFLGYLTTLETQTLLHPILHASISHVCSMLVNLADCIKIQQRCERMGCFKCDGHGFDVQCASLPIIATATVLLGHFLIWLREKSDVDYLTALGQHVINTVPH